MAFDKESGYLRRLVDTLGANGGCLKLLSPLLLAVAAASPRGVETGVVERLVIQNLFQFSLETHQKPNMIKDRVYR
jgi:hypothetical protein